jgi:tRNA-(ms[2]io[6]A)-hydroxylase
MATEENSILGLKLPTDPRWVNLAEISLDDILNDHAYCEQKAATSCITLIQANADKMELVEALSPIVSEEWGHFRLVLNEMKKRNITLQPQRKDEYVNALKKHEKKGGSYNDRFLDKLLIFALIEARSCERFRLLSEGLDDEKLKKFYHKFMISEAGHYRLFLDLAYLYLDKDKVKERWSFWLNKEEEILGNLPVRGDRMH